MANTKLPARLLDTSAIPALNVTGDLTVDTTTLKVDSTNNRVGIGTSSPSSPLHVTAAQNAGWIAQLINTGTGSDANGLDIHAGVDISDYILRLREKDGSDVMVVKYGSKVGIGTTAPGSSLELKRTTASGGYGEYPALTIRNDHAAGYGAIHFNEGSTQRARIEVGNNSGSPYLLLNAGGGSTGIRIAADGNVGIGTSSPNSYTGYAALTINGTNGGLLDFETNGTFVGEVYANSTAGLGLQAIGSRTIALRTNSADRMTIDGSGNISTNALTAVTSAGGGIWYDAANKYLSISHWASSARPTPAAMLHLTDNSNDLDVPQIRIEGRENPGDTKLDISVKDAGARINLIEGPVGDANAGHGLMEFKTNSAANTTYPRRGGFKFDVNTTTPVEILNTGTLQLHGNSAAWSETTPGHTKGSIHLDPATNTDHHGNAITFGASDHNNGESTTAGIYVRTDGSYGSYMYLATSDSYASGAKMGMRINHSGHIHAPRGYITSQVPAFNAYYNGNSFAPGGNYIFAANATRFNNGGNYNTSNYRFTAPVDGLYHFYFRTITNGSGTNQHVVFRKNGSDYSGTNQHFSPNTGTAWAQLQMESLFDLADGDWIDVRFVTLGITIHGNAWNEFSGYLVG
jgi:hypothetical protein